MEVKTKERTTMNDDEMGEKKERHFDGANIFAKHKI